MNEPTESKKTKARSPNFPFITLEQALERARQFYDKEKRGAAPVAVAASHWGYSVNSSALLQTAGALKNYGLMSDEGSGESRELRLTELALRILLDARPDSTERETFKRQAALMPSVAADVYAKWEGSLPSKASLIHYLLLDRSFNEQTAKKVADILYTNELLTCNLQSILESEIPQTPNDKHSMQTEPPHVITPSPGVLRLVGNAPIVKNTTPPHLQAGPSTIGGAGTVTRGERIIGPTGEIVLSFAGEPSWEAYNFLRKYIDLRLTLLKPASSASGSAPSGDAEVRMMMDES